MADAATLALYRVQAPRYTEAFYWEPNRNLDQFLDRLPPPKG